MRHGCLRSMFVWFMFFTILRSVPSYLISYCLLLSPFYIGMFPIYILFFVLSYVTSCRIVVLFYLILCYAYGTLHFLSVCCFFWRTFIFSFSPSHSIQNYLLSIYFYAPRCSVVSPRRICLPSFVFFLFPVLCEIATSCVFHF